MRVSSAEFVKRYGALTDKALSEAVTITRNGRDRLVVLSAEEYARLKRRDRRVVKLENFTDDDGVDRHHRGSGRLRSPR